MTCQYCDGRPSTAATYEGQVCLPLNGKVICIDHCIHKIVAALNAGGVETVACCCGHGQQQGRIDLADGRVLWIGSDTAPMTLTHQKDEYEKGTNHPK